MCRLADLLWQTFIKGYGICRVTMCLSSDRESRLLHHCRSRFAPVAFLIEHFMRPARSCRPVFTFGVTGAAMSFSGDGVLQAIAGRIDDDQDAGLAGIGVAGPGNEFPDAQAPV